MLHASWMASLPGDGTFCQVLEGSALSSLYMVLGAFSHLYHDPTNLKDPGVDYKSLASPPRKSSTKLRSPSINHNHPKAMPNSLL